MHTTEHILLVRPSRFVFNAETAGSNAFQQKPDLAVDVAMKAAGEFDRFAEKLRSRGVNVIVIDDTDSPVKPDAVFPNNWVTFHRDGTVVLYPMYAANRRAERRPDILEKLKEKFVIRTIIDLSGYEAEHKYLEGTGSIIFDHIHKIAYACISPRTDEMLFKKTCGMLGYSPVAFHAYDRGAIAIYHTNVMMCIAEKFTIICMESIPAEERAVVSGWLKKSGHTIIEITLAQTSHFAGNMLAVKNDSGQDILVLSQSAYDILTAPQKQLISAMCEMLPMPITTIETVGGGSARCMMAEVFLPLKDQAV